MILNEQEVGNENARWQAVEVIETNLVANLVTRPVTLSRPRERLRKRTLKEDGHCSVWWGDGNKRGPIYFLTTHDFGHSRPAGFSP